MDTAVRTPPGSPGEILLGSDAKGRRGWRLRLLVAALILLMVSAIGGGVWIARYDPFVVGNYGFPRPRT